MLNLGILQTQTLIAWRYTVYSTVLTIRCRVTYYINHPQEICENVFLMMQLLATMARAPCFYSENALFQTPFHVLPLCCGEICLEQFLRLGLNKRETCPISSTSCTRSYTHLQSKLQASHSLLFRDLNNIENNNQRALYTPFQFQL